MRKRRLGGLKNDPMRARSSLLIGAYCDSVGAYWKSLRDALPFVAKKLGIDADGKRRSALAIECGYAIEAKGIAVPENFIPPWDRCVYGSGMPIIQRSHEKEPI